MAEQPKVSVILEAIDKITEPVNGIKGGLDRLASGFTSVLKAAAALAGTAALGEFFKSSVDAAIESEETVGLLSAALKKVGLSYADVKAQIEPYLATLQKTTRFTDEDARTALAHLVTITGSYTKSLGLLSLTADVAEYKHITMAEAAEYVGKVSIGAAKKMGDFGIAVAGAGDSTEKLRSAVGGLAEEAGGEFGVKVIRLGNLWEDFKEAIGRALIGSDALRGGLDGLADKLVSMAEWIDKNSDSIGKVVTGLFNFAEGLVKVGGAALDVIKPLVDLVGVVGGAVKWMATLGGTLSWFGDKHEETVTKIAEGQVHLSSAWAMHAERRVSQTKEEITAEAAATSEGAKKTQALIDKAATDRAAADKRSHDNLAALQEIAYQAAEKLLGVHQQQVDDLTHKFQEKMKDMSEDDWAQAQLLLESELQKMRESWIAYSAKVVDSQDRTNQQLIGGIATVSGALDDQAAPITKAALKWDLFKMSATSTGAAIRDGADKIGAFANALGVADPQLNQVIDGVGQLGDALTSIGSGDVFGGLTGAIGSLQGILGGLFGTSPEEQARRALLAQNSQALKDLHSDYGKILLQNDTGAQIAGLQALGASRTLEASQSDLRDNTIASTKVASWLASQGLSLSDLNKVAENSGVDLGLKGGKYSLSALSQFVQGLQGVSVAGYDTTSVQGRLDTRAFQNQLAGGSGLTLQDYQDILSGPGGSPFLAQLFQGDPAGLSARLQAAGLNINSLTPGALGGVSANQAKSILTGIAGLLGAGTGDSAASSLVSTFADSTSAPASTALSSGSDTTALLTGILGGVERTATNTEVLPDLLPRLVSAAEATAAAVSGDGLTNTVDRALYLAGVNSALNSGTAG